MKFQAKSQVHLLNGTPLKIKGRDALLGEILFEICKKAAVQDPDTRRQLFVCARVIHNATFGPGDGIVQIDDETVYQTLRHHLWHYLGFDNEEVGVVADLLESMKKASEAQPPLHQAAPAAP